MLQRFGVAGLRVRELAGLPELDQLLQAGEQAREGSQNEGVQDRHQPGRGGVVVGLRPHVGGNAGDVLGQGWGRVN